MRLLLKEGLILSFSLCTFYFEVPEKDCSDMGIFLL